MTYLNGILGWGALAFSIPLIIHLLNRSRYREVQWGAMHLLESVIRVNHRKFHLEQLLLLLIRCSIPALLAFCLAQPVLTGSRTLERDAPVSLVILLDNSYSMDTTGPRGSGFEQAVEAASRIIAETGKGSQYHIIQTGGGPVPLFDQPVTDRQAVIRRLSQLQGGYGRSDMGAALNKALEVIPDLRHPRREFIVISDFQPADWDDTKVDAQGIQAQLKSMEIPPFVTLMTVGEEYSENITVEGLEFATKALGVGQQLAIRANLHNYGSSDYNNARIVLRVDGQEQAVTQMDLPGAANSQALFPISFDAPGSHVLQVNVVSEDSLATDNRAAAAVSVWESVPVLLVNGDPGNGPLQGETDYLSVALTPFTFGRVRLTDLITTTTVAPAELKPELLVDTRLVVLANVPRLTDDQLRSLTQFVSQGGALLVTCGNRIDLTWYREKFFAGGSGLLPAAFGSVRGESEDNKGESARIVAQHFDHPALQHFNNPSTGTLSNAEIRRWYALDSAVTASEDEEDEASPDESQSEWVTLAQLDSGDPLLVEKSIGEGVVLQMTTTVDADWNNLPVQPAYVPLMQQLVTTMASRITPPRNIQTGQPAVAILRDSVESESQKPATVSVILPDGSRRTVTAEIDGRHQILEFNATQRPGVYTMSLPSAENVHFVAETSRIESDSERMASDEIQDLADQLGGSAVDSVESWIAQDQLRRHGRGIWRYALAAFLIFLFLEVILQQKFARVKR